MGRGHHVRGDVGRLRLRRLRRRRVLPADRQGRLGVTDVKVTARIFIAESTGFYTFLRKVRACVGQTTISMDAILGLRTWWLRANASSERDLFAREGSQAWVDPLAGLIFRFNLVRGHVPIPVRGDFGGHSAPELRRKPYLSTSGFRKEGVCSGYQLIGSR